MTDYRQLTKPPSLDLALPEERDAPALFALVQAEKTRLSKTLPWPPLIVRVEDELANIRHNRINYASGRSAVYVLRWEGAIAGIVGFNTINGAEAEIGYWLAAEFEGRGVMTEAVRALMAWYRDTGRLDTFILRCGVGNLASNRVAQRLGFDFHYRQPRGEKIGDSYVDHNVYRWRAKDR